MNKKILLSILAVTALANANTNLQTITVTASDRFDTTLANTTANVTVITSKEIEENGYVTLKDALTHVASINFASNGGAGQSTSMYMRGFGSGNVQILLNGVPLKDPTDPSFNSSIANIMLSNVDRIEVIKGAQSGLWGADAVAGVINIVTKKTAKEAYIGYGKYKTKQAGFSFGQDLGKVAFSLSGNYYKTDGFSALEPRNAEADGYENKNLDFSTDFKINENNKVSIFYNYIDGKGDFDDVANANSTAEKSKFKQNTYGVKYSYEDNDLKLNLLASNNEIKRGLKGISIYGPWKSKTKGEVTRYTLTAQKSFDKHLVSGGLEYNKYKATTDFGFGESKDSFDDKAIWLGYGYRFDNLLNAKTIVNATLRYDKFDKFKNKLTYRLGVKRYCTAIDGLHSGFNIYSAYKVPSLYQFANKSGSDLKPESTIGFEISAGYKELLNLTFFYDKTKDSIKYNNTTWKYYNLAYNETRKGIELSSKYNFEEIPLTIGFNYTHLLKVKDKNGNAYINIPKNSANLFVDYNPTNNITVGADVQYVGKRVGYGNVNLKSYTIANLHYNQEINDNLTLNITVKNLFDKKYEEVKNYSTSGRAIYAKIKYSF